MNLLFLRVLRVLRGPAFAFLLLFPVCAAATKPVHYGLFGNVHVGAPAGTPKRTVVFISDRGGWDARAEALASALADDGSLVLGIDLPAYLRELLSIKDKCALPSAHVEEMSHWMQREQKLAAFSAPVLAGDGAGATRNAPSASGADGLPASPAHNGFGNRKEKSQPSVASAANVPFGACASMA